MKDLPKWAVEMSEEEWLALPGDGNTNCVLCRKRLVLTLCKYDEPAYYCINCCSEHKWQSTWDWPVECARCGIHYDRYLESVLQEHGIEYQRLGHIQISDSKEETEAC